jgi:hypothetical protein
MFKEMVTTRAPWARTGSLLSNTLSAGISRVHVDEDNPAAAQYLRFSFRRSHPTAVIKP